jgi:hypothetical protein
MREQNSNIKKEKADEMNHRPNPNQTNKMKRLNLKLSPYGVIPRDR